MKYQQYVTNWVYVYIAFLPSYTFIKFSSVVSKLYSDTKIKKLIYPHLKNNFIRVLTWNVSTTEESWNAHK